MVDDTGHTLEQPVVWAVANHEDAGGDAKFVCTYAAPALGDERAYAGGVDCVEDDARQCVRIFDDNGAEPYVDGRGTSIEEGCEFWVGRIRGGQIEEKEAGDVDVVLPIVRLRYERGRPDKMSEDEPASRRVYTEAPVHTSNKCRGHAVWKGDLEPRIKTAARDQDSWFGSG
jgi:hypothetical protein